MGEIPQLKWFLAGNVYSGSVRQEDGLACFQCKIKKVEEELCAWCWYGANCLEATPEEQVEAERFPADAQGREAMVNWLEEQRKRL